MPDLIDGLVEDIDRHMERGEAGPDAAVRSEVNEAFGDLYGEIVELRGDDAYHDFLLSFVAREVEKFRTPAADHGYDDNREDPVCTCNDIQCELKQGRLPVEVRSADDYDRGIRAFRQDHRGHPRVLDEAQAAWRDKRGRVVTELRDMVVALGTDHSLADVRALRQGELDPAGDDEGGSAGEAPADD